MKKEEESEKSHHTIKNSTSRHVQDYAANVSIDELHDDLEKKLHEQGFIFDKKKFVFQDQHLTFGERIADKVAKFGGSWKFIILFASVIISWIMLNLFWLANPSFDPFPFILLNLCLSCLAALQAPIIMMSQNRHAIKEQRQQEINLEKDIVDFKQDRLDLILDQKQWQLLKKMNEKINKIEKKLGIAIDSKKPKTRSKK